MKHRLTDAILGSSARFVRKSDGRSHCGGVGVRGNDPRSEERQLRSRLLLRGNLPWRESCEQEHATIKTTFGAFPDLLQSDFVVTVRAGQSDLLFALC